MLFFERPAMRAQTRSEKKDCFVPPQQLEEDHARTRQGSVASGGAIGDAKPLANTPRAPLPTNAERLHAVSALPALSARHTRKELPRFEEAGPALTSCAYILEGINPI